MAPSVMVKQDVDLSKEIFSEVLDYKSRTGLGSCELHRIEDFLRQANVSFGDQDLSVAVNDLIFLGYIRLELYRFSEVEPCQVSLELTGKTARPF